MEVSGQLHASAALTRRERTAGVKWIGCWLGPSRSGRREIPSSRRELNPDYPDRPACSLVAIPMRYPGSSRRGC